MLVIENDMTQTSLRDSALKLIDKFAAASADEPVGAVVYALLAMLNHTLEFTAQSGRCPPDIFMELINTVMIGSETACKNAAETYKPWVPT